MLEGCHNRRGYSMTAPADLATITLEDFAGHLDAIFAIAVWLTLWVVLARVLRGRKIREETPPARQLVIGSRGQCRGVPG